jgi:hypothetical protein
MQCPEEGAKADWVIRKTNLARAEEAAEKGKWRANSVRKQMAGAKARFCFQ